MDDKLKKLFETAIAERKERLKTTSKDDSAALAREIKNLVEVEASIEAMGDAFDAESLDLPDFIARVAKLEPGMTIEIVSIDSLASVANDHWYKAQVE